MLKCANRSNLNRSCPHCRMSKGERRIKCFLESLKLNFDTEYSFANCKYINPLLFDFIVWTNDQFFLIEYQGEQHYQIVDFSYRPIRDEFYTKKLNENFKNLQLRDQIKRDWTKNNNVPLLEIPYWNFNNIESILENFIKENYE